MRTVSALLVFATCAGVCLQGAVAAPAMSPAPAVSPAVSNEAPASPAPGREALQVALQAYFNARPKIDRELGADVATDIFVRLSDDVGQQGAPPPPGYVPADWRETLANTAGLDVDLTRQLLAEDFTPISARSGLQEILLRSKVDGTWQPVCLYIPSTRDQHGNAPLAIVLHGRLQTEVELLSQPYLRRLADDTGTILAAPFGRDKYDFAEPAETDVYDELAELQTRLPVDTRRTYLVGYSMGAFSLYLIGPRGGYRWAAALGIAGAILGSAVPRVRSAWQDLPIYIVTGLLDDDIPTKWPQQTAVFLAGVGLPVSLYVEPLGNHPVRTLMPALTRAWHDMHARIVRADSVQRSNDARLPADRVPRPYSP